VHGILTRDDMIAGLRRSGAGTPVAEMMRADIPTVPQSIVMQQCRCPALALLDSAGRLVGLFTPENVGEMIMVQSAIGSRSR
jgi:predicted transcriptional regulator